MQNLSFLQIHAHKKLKFESVQTAQISFIFLLESGFQQRIKWMLKTMTMMQSPVA